MRSATARLKRRSSYDRSCSGTLRPFWPCAAGVVSCTLGAGGPVPLRLLLSRSSGPLGSTALLRSVAAAPAGPTAALDPAPAPAPAFLNLPPIPSIQLTSTPRPASMPSSSPSPASSPSQYALGKETMALPSLPFHPPASLNGFSATPASLDAAV